MHIAALLSGGMDRRAGNKWALTSQESSSASELTRDRARSRGAPRFPFVRSARKWRNGSLTVENNLLQVGEAVVGDDRILMEIGEVGGKNDRAE